MNKLLELAKTTMEHLKEEGVKDTVYMIKQYILRYVRIHSVKKTDYFDYFMSPFRLFRLDYLTNGIFFGIV